MEGVAGQPPNVGPGCSAIQGSDRITKRVMFRGKVMERKRVLPIHVSSGHQT